MRSFDLAWQRRLHDAGFAGLSWPAEHGGQAAPLLYELIWAEELAASGAPWAGTCFVGLHHAGPTLMALGAPEQQQRWLPGILRGEAVWCQGFSEPGAGSDLGSLRTHGRIVGDHLVVSGQKIWSSFAHLADHQELLVRTGGDGERGHAGLTFAVCDLDALGIEIRPIETMAGTADFCEVLYDEVRIPVDHVVGEIGGGWAVAMASLAIERGAAFMAEQIELGVVVDRVAALARDRVDRRGRPRIADDGIAARLAMLKAEAIALRGMTITNLGRAERDSIPGPAAAMVRLYYAELIQRVHRLAFDLLGDEALLSPPVSDPWVFHYARSPAQTIGAGTRDIQRSMIAERVLGLPRAR